MKRANSKGMSVGSRGANESRGQVGLVTVRTGGDYLDWSRLPRPARLPRLDGTRTGQRVRWRYVNGTRTSQGSVGGTLASVVPNEYLASAHWY